MNKANYIPTGSYGILRQELSHSTLDQVAEQIKILGYAVLDSGYSFDQLQKISTEFDRLRQIYLNTFNEHTLKKIGEFHTIRSPLTLDGNFFLDLVFNENLLSLLKKIIPGKFILNQQNGIINPPQEPYNQGLWHRDLPYQHFVSSTPLALNALFCVDDFTFENGGTFVLAGTHKNEALPSQQYIQKNAIQIQAKAGSFIVLDCMLFHAGGFNKTNSARRAVNHIFNIPFFKQQINIPANINKMNLSPEAKDILGFNFVEPVSISDYLSTRANKNY